MDLLTKDPRPNVTGNLLSLKHQKPGKEYGTYAKTLITNVLNPSYM